MDLLTTKQAAEFLDVAEGTLENWRINGKGPRYYKPEGKVYYISEDLVEWVKLGKKDVE